MFFGYFGRRSYLPAFCINDDANANADPLLAFVLIHCGYDCCLPTCPVVPFLIHACLNHRHKAFYFGLLHTSYILVSRLYTNL